MFGYFIACTGLSVTDCVLLFCAFAVSAVGFVVLVGFVVFVGFAVLAVFVVSVEVVVVAVSPLDRACDGNFDN